MKPGFSILSLFALSCLVWQCTPSLQWQGSSDSVTYQRKLDMRVMGVKRNYRLHVPANYNPQKQTALVVVIHGAFSTARKMEMESGFSEVADQEGFLVAYPSGAYGIFGLFQHWNAGHCCGKAASDGIDDVAFLDAVIDDISLRFRIDTRRIYMVGFSNGGMLTYLYSAERTHRLAAAAVLAASLAGRSSSESSWWQTPQPSEPLPMIIFHGLDDTVVPYKGGVSPRKGGQREYASVPDSVQFWVENNNCRKDSIEDKLYEGRITRKSWADIQGENRVVLYSIDNWGHEWPGPFFTGDLDKNDTFRNFNAADLIWDFFQQ
jgi:polyhydroxybutyrate depolymerase